LRVPASGNLLRNVNLKTQKKLYGIGDNRKKKRGGGKKRGKPKRSRGEKESSDHERNKSEKGLPTQATARRQLWRGNKGRKKKSLKRRKCKEIGVLR